MTAVISGHRSFTAIRPLRLGAGSESLPVADRAMLHADNAYHLPACADRKPPAEDQHRNRPPPFAALAGPQGMVGIERVMDHIAHHLGHGPGWQVRRAITMPIARPRGAVSPPPRIERP